VFNVNFISISAISWRKQILQITFYFYQTLRNNTYVQIKEKNTRMKTYYLERKNTSQQC